MQQRWKRNGVSIGKRDKISTLPDALLHRILSFLQTQEVVQTSVLSRRWRNVWTCVPDLNLDFHSFQSSGYYSEKVKSFKQFVVGILSFRNGSNIQKFNISFGGGVEPSFIKMVVCFAVCHNVQQLSINFPSYFDKMFEWPLCFFTCESLTALQLKGNSYIINALQKSLGLQALKTMHLENFDFIVMDKEESSLSSCPNLENLILVGCRLINLNISAPQLKNLEILQSEHDYRRVVEAVVVVSTPKLTSFKFKGYHPPLLVSREDLSCVDQVLIIVPSFRGYSCYPDEWMRKTPQKLITMLTVLRNAKSLTLSSIVIELLSKVPSLLEREPFVFCNLRHLKLIADSKGQTTINIPASVTPYLLKSAPCLETMVMELPKG